MARLFFVNKRVARFDFFHKQKCAYKFFRFFLEKKLTQEFFQNCSGYKFAKQVARTFRTFIFFRLVL